MRMLYRLVTLKKPTGPGKGRVIVMHGGKNYPFHKVAGCLDVELSDGTGDDAYLELLSRSLPDAIAASRADLVVYLAGADPHEGASDSAVSLQRAYRDRGVVENAKAFAMLERVSPT